MGHGEEDAYEIVSVELDVPLQGVVTVHQTSGFNLILERHRKGNILVYRANGVLYSVVSGTPVPEDWTLLGSFHSLIAVDSKPAAQQERALPLFEQKSHH